MVVDERLDRLSRQLSWQSLGPMDTVINEITNRLTASGAALVAGLRQAAYERPLITLLLSWQVGYLIGRMGHRHAHR
jgi:hypothetical protein